jgi:hypothetical protein
MCNRGKIIRAEQVGHLSKDTRRCAETCGGRVLAPGPTKSTVSRNMDMHQPQYGYATSPLP